MGSVAETIQKKVIGSVAKPFILRTTQKGEAVNIGKASAVFCDIDNDRYTEDEKYEAVRLVLAMPTHNGIAKQYFVKAMRWLLVHQEASGRGSE